MRFLAALCAMSFLAMPALAQMDLSTVKITSQKLSERVHVLFGAGGNIGVFLGDERTLLIDDQFLPLGQRIEKAVKALKRQDIAFLINTHYHGDHTGANAYFAKDGALIIAHDNVHKRLSAPQVSGFTGATIDAASMGARPVMSYSQTQTIYQDGQTIRLIHVGNAHTDGDTLVYFEDDNIIHMGDTFFYDRWPYIDAQAKGSLPGMIAALDTGLALINDETIVIPGHGAITNRAAMVKARGSLVDIEAKAKAFAAAGGTRAGFIASNPARAYRTINAYGADWTNRFLGTAFDSVSP